MRYGGRTVESSGQEWVEGVGVHREKSIVRSESIERVYILNNNPDGTLIKTQIRPGSLLYCLSHGRFTEAAFENRMNRVMDTSRCLHKCDSCMYDQGDCAGEPVFTHDIDDNLTGHDANIVVYCKKYEEVEDEEVTGV